MPVGAFGQCVRFERRKMRLQRGLTIVLVIAVRFEAEWIVALRLAILPMFEDPSLQNQCGHSKAAKAPGECTASRRIQRCMAKGSAAEAA